MITGETESNDTDHILLEITFDESVLIFEDLIVTVDLEKDHSTQVERHEDKFKVNIFPTESIPPGTSFVINVENPNVVSDLYDNLMT